MPGIICNEKAGASSLYTCLPGVDIDNKGYMPQLLEEQDLPRTYLAHHELESELITVIILSFTTAQGICSGLQLDIDNFARHLLRIAAC